jgi:predicted nucleotidyltransferase
MNLDRETILRALEEHRPELRRLGVRRIGLFGSYLHGWPREGSDLDFLVRFERPTFDVYMDTKFFLQDLFSREVDLVTEDALKPALDHVRREVAWVIVQEHGPSLHADLRASMPRLEKGSEELVRADRDAR